MRSGFRSPLPFLAPALLLLGACSHATATGGAPQPVPVTDSLITRGPQGLQPGDELRITVFRKLDLSGEFPVNLDGTIVHPVYRSVEVAGVPFADLDSLVGRRIREVEGNSPFVVEPLIRVTVGGSVRTPNFYFVRPDVTIPQLLVLAGATSDESDVRNLQLIRNGRRYVIDLATAPLEVQNLRLASGDQLFVPKARGPIFTTVIAPTATVVALVISLANFIIAHH